MKKKLLALFLVAALLLCGGCRKATLEGYKVFHSTPLGFQMEYPDFWERSLDNKQGIVAFVTPAEGYGDDHLESLSVQRFTLDMTGETAYNDYVKGYVATLEKSLANYSLVSETENATLGGEPAYKIEYESYSDDKTDELRFMQIFAQHGGKVYVVTYMAEFTSYSYFLTNVEQMLSTFAFV